MLLSQGFSAYEHQAFTTASGFFEAAVHSEELNDAGLAIAFWYLYRSHLQLGNDNAAIDALVYFLTSAQDANQLIDQPSTLRLPTGIDSEAAGSMVFDLPEHIQTARGLLAHFWASKQPGFGQSPAYPIPVHHWREQQSFFSGFAHCYPSLLGPDHSPLQKVVLHCPAHTERVYYFEWQP